MDVSETRVDSYKFRIEDFKGIYVVTLGSEGISMSKGKGMKGVFNRLSHPLSICLNVRSPHGSRVMKV